MRILWMLLGRAGWIRRASFAAFMPNVELHPHITHQAAQLLTLRRVHGRPVRAIQQRWWQDEGLTPLEHALGPWGQG